ncbi:HAD-IB family phosphatase [bacterium]
MKYKMVVFDVDGTLTNHDSSWRYIHEQINTWENKAEQFLIVYKQGEIDYKTFCLEESKFWKGLNVDFVEEIFNNIKLIDNCVDVLLKFKNEQYKIALLSTGLQYIAKRISKQIEFDYVLTNQLLDDGLQLTGDVVLNVYDEQKHHMLSMIANKFGIGLNEVIYIGDGHNDIECAKIAGYSVGLNSSNEELANIVSHNVRSDDLNDIFNIIANA